MIEVQEDLTSIPLLKVFQSAHVVVFDSSTGLLIAVNAGSDFHKFNTPLHSCDQFRSSIEHHMVLGTTNCVELSNGKQKMQFIFSEQIIDNAVVFAFVPSPAQSAMYDDLKNEISSDFLTGVMSRKSILESAKQNEIKCSTSLHVCSVLMIDIDFFKRVNDTHGHDVGDIVLKNVATTIKGVLRETDLLGRLGGEEFLVLLPNTSTNGASLVASKILRSVEKKQIDISDDTPPVSITVSIGISSIDSFVGCSIETSLKNADIALYAAKSNGRNCYELI